MIPNYIEVLKDTYKFIYFSSTYSAFWGKIYKFKAGISVFDKTFIYNA